MQGTGFYGNAIRQVDAPAKGNVWNGRLQAIRGFRLRIYWCLWILSATMTVISCVIPASSKSAWSVFSFWVLRPATQSEVEVRQPDNHGTITARDNYELTRNIPKCVSVERLCNDVNMQLPFNADEINLIYQFGEQSKEETCASLSAILPQIKDSDTKQIVSTTLKKLNAMSEESCMELTATTKRRKVTIP